LTSILERIHALQDDPTIGEKGARLVAELAFKPTSDTMTGEDLAVALATLLAYGQAIATQPDADVKVESSEGGKVFTAAISDSVRMRDALGG
jgi:hypothetical protein